MYGDEYAGIYHADNPARNFWQFRQKNASPDFHPLLIPIDIAQRSLHDAVTAYDVSAAAQGEDSAYYVAIILKLRDEVRELKQQLKQKATNE
jgi:hypothetical protein